MFSRFWLSGWPCSHCFVRLLPKIQMCLLRLRSFLSRPRFSSPATEGATVNERELNQIKNAVEEVSRTMERCTHLILHALATSKSCDQPATKADLKELETKIMAKLDELVAAATALSTASDAVSVKLDTLITDVDRVLAALQNADLPPEATAAIATLQASRDKAAAAGDKVDAEVAKVDTVLPQPAPPAPTT